MLKQGQQPPSQNIDYIIESLLSQNSELQDESTNEIMQYINNRDYVSDEEYQEIINNPILSHVVFSLGQFYNEIKQRNDQIFPLKEFLDQFLTGYFQLRKQSPQKADWLAFMIAQNSLLYLVNPYTQRQYEELPDGKKKKNNYECI